MAHVAQAFPRRAHRLLTKGSKWDRYMDGQIWMLVEGVDMEKAVSARAAFWRRAKALGFSVKTHRAKDALYVKAFRREPASA